MGNMPPDLGLPGNWDNNNIPSGKYLQDIARRQLHEINTFLTLHKNDYKFVAANLDKITEILKAALEVKGPHQEKVIRRALELEDYYWVTHGKIDAWVDLLGPMLNHALNMGDPELCSRLFHSWGVYIYLTESGQKLDATQNAFNKALEYAAESEREDIRLLAQVERLNLDAHDPAKFEHVQKQASILLKKAQEIHYLYTLGRVYLALAIAHRIAGNMDAVFEYAQQSLVTLLPEQHDVVAGQSILYMLQLEETDSPYKKQLLAYMDFLLTRSSNVILQSLSCQTNSCRLYKEKQYEEARQETLRSCQMDRKNHYRGNYGPNRHMLALVHTELHHWETARHHLLAAYKEYQRQKDQPQIVNVSHAMAYISLVQKNYSRAYEELNQVLELAYNLPPSKRREHIIEIVQTDILQAQRGLNGH